MVAVGFAVLWGAYTLGIWGYCLIRGYDVPFSGLFGKTWPGGGQQQPSTLPPTDPGTGTYGPI